MKKKILILCLFIFSLSTTQAQLLWEVTGNGLKHPSYLFGTHHFISIQFLDSIPGLYKAFNECDAVIGEIVFNNIDATSQIQKAAIMPKHTKIEDLLNAEEYKIADTELKSVLKFGLKDVSIMNPSLILNMYEMEIYKKKTGFSDNHQSDSFFQLVASEKDKNVIGLEDVNQQIAVLFGNGSLEQQADHLVEIIQHKDSVINEMILQNKLYKAGKIDELQEQAKSNTTGMTTTEYAKLIEDRNADWVAKLHDYFKQSPCFVAVDAIHLGGKNGLIKLLEKDGYKVKAVE
ncbi:MAG: TraB/GumN family protein [Paludibacter sp.]|nr:TraB/GumN family protein [Paludibacter sp.]